MNTENKFLISGIFTAIAASLCCITPIIAFISGVTGIASTFSWLESFRPYLIIFTILVLSFAWYQKLKLKEQIDCSCDENNKPKFIYSKNFLSILTGFIILMLAFPHYAYIFYPKKEKKMIIIEKSSIKAFELKIIGMTCKSCAMRINHEVNKLNGIISSNVSYKIGNAIIKFDNSKISIHEIEKIINSTGYRVTNKKEILNGNSN